MTRRRFTTRLLVAALLTVGAVSCAENADDGSGETGSPDAPATGVAVSNDWAIEFTGGAEGPADDSLPPVRIGFVSGGGGAAAVPDATFGTEAAVAYANAELGGIDGHPIELVSCVIAVAEDGQTCGSQMANDDEIPFVLFGASAIGNAEFYGVIGGHKPVIGAVGIAADDFTNPASTIFGPGLPGAAMAQMWVLANEVHSTRVVVAFEESDPGRNAFNLVARPTLEALGVSDVTGAPIDPTAAGPEVQQALVNAGIRDADGMAIVAADPVCIAVHDALDALAAEVPVVGVPPCQAATMTEHLATTGAEGPVPDGWYFVSALNNPYLPAADVGTDVFLAKAAEYGDADIDLYGTFAGPAFSQVLNVMQIANGLGFEGLSAEAFGAAALDFTGPAMMAPGPISCPGAAPFVPLCGSQVEITRFLDGEWQPVRSMIDGNPFDISEL